MLNLNAHDVHRSGKTVQMCVLFEIWPVCVEGGHGRAAAKAQYLTNVAHAVPLVPRPITLQYVLADLISVMPH